MTRSNRARSGGADVTVVVPTFNEAPNIARLVARVEAATAGMNAELLFVDDSTDATPTVITTVAGTTPLPVRLIHRADPAGGLSGAVMAGFAASAADWCVVMDGDLQHPPELIPLLPGTARQTGADVVVASRHVDGGSASGLGSGVRHLVSRGSTILTRAMFPVRLRDCTDPMTGFFAVRRSSIDVTALRPRGFKILLELLARQRLTVAEEPFVFAARNAGESKADWRQGLRFLAQLAALRFGRLSRFAGIGALGAVANLLIMAVLQSVGVGYLAAAIVAGIATILGNFALQERFVFQDLRHEGRGIRTRLAQSLAFNGTETVVRTALLWLLVESTPLPSLLAQALLIAIGFVLRFVYHSRIVYRPKRTSPISPLLTALNETAPEDTEAA